MPVRAPHDRPDAPAATVGGAFWMRCAIAVAVRPRLWVSALRVWLRATPRGWWRRAPFVPVPDAAFLGFRFETAYGHHGRPAVGDFVAYLEWVHRRA